MASANILVDPTMTSEAEVTDVGMGAGHLYSTKNLILAIVASEWDMSSNETALFI